MEAPPPPAPPGGSSAARQHSLRPWESGMVREPGRGEAAGKGNGEVRAVTRGALSLSYPEKLLGGA